MLIVVVICERAGILANSGVSATIAEVEAVGCELGLTDGAPALSRATVDATLLGGSSGAETPIIGAVEGV